MASRRAGVAAGIACALLLGGAWFALRPEATPPPAEPPRAEGGLRLPPPPDIVPAETPAPEPAAPLDPEMQPRTTYVREFRGLAELPPGFRAEGLALAPEGLQLAPGDGPRKGFLYSPDEPAEFPLSALAPLWKPVLPDGTRIDLEFALSPDGKSWGPWTRVIADPEAADEISPTYPDGRPNPFYGFLPGGNFAYGEERWAAFRYRFVLASTGAPTPTLEAIRFYYQDTTLGQGTVGSVHTLEKLAGQLPPSDDFPAEPSAQDAAP
jgi:hypothetical protein